MEHERWERQSNGGDSTRSTSGMESPTKRQRHGNITDGDTVDEHAFQWESEPRPGRFDADDGDQDDDDGAGLGLLEAFENFNLRAEKRVQELLSTTDATLFALESDPNPVCSLAPPQTPSYVLMSDQYRLARPPQFHHWRQCFPYLQITGKSSFDLAPDEHIQIRPSLVAPAQSSVDGSSVGTASVGITVVGTAIHLQLDVSDPPQEELILVDGEMEEVLEEDEPYEEDEGEEVDNSGDNRRPLPSALSCVSPRTSQANERVDAITLACFRACVPPVVTALCEKILRKQQLELETARLQNEEAERLTTTAEITAREERRAREQLAEQERIRYAAEVAQAEAQERAREETRREELLRQQREENDEEEIKIRTLAYTHTREWYQPHKKCFSHRGRKMTYLKPVLKVQQDGERSEPLVDDTTGAGGETHVPRKPSSPRRRKTHSHGHGHGHRHKSSPPREIDVENAKSPAVSPQPSPQANTPHVQLPLLPRVSSSHKKPFSGASASQSLGRKRSWDDDDDHTRSAPPPAAAAAAAQLNGSSSKAPSATIAAPSRVYGISPYRIPPATLKTELKRDAVATARRQSHPRKSQLDERQ